MNYLLVPTALAFLFIQESEGRLIALSSCKTIATWLRAALGLNRCDPNVTYYDYYAQQYGYTKFSETPHCKFARFVFGDPDEDQFRIDRQYTIGLNNDQLTTDQGKSRRKIKTNAG